MTTVWPPREVPLGGLRAMRVRRTLPAVGRTLIGGWCFIDHYGPDLVTASGGMSVAPHPHSGLQTVSWLFEGEIQHRDSAGNQALVKPGELNLMTAGRGISHSEVSTDQTTVLHGVQLWVALPDRHREAAPGFTHFAPGRLETVDFTARVFLGELWGEASPVATYSPLLGAEITLAPGATVEVAIAPGFEHGVLVDRGVVAVGDQEVRQAELGYREPGHRTLRLASATGARLVLLGGEPLGEQVVMWWNFLGRTHEEIVDFRTEWQRQIAERGPGATVAPGRFGVVPDEALPAISAPDLPPVRLKART